MTLFAGPGQSPQQLSVFSCTLIVLKVLVIVQDVIKPHVDAQPSDPALITVQGAPVHAV